MNCEEVRKQLSEFLDKTLDFEGVENIENHLAACSRCSEELASLALCQRLVSGLPAVDPPIGFAARVMADVRDTIAAAKWWERLFFPLRTKIPLQATAAILLGILSLYVYQKEESREQPLSIAPQGLSLPQDKAANVTNQASTPPQKKEGPNREIAPIAPAQEAPKAAANAEPQSQLEAKKERPRSTPIPAQGVAASQEGFGPPGELARRPPAISLESFRHGRSSPFPPQAERALSSQAEPIADYELVVRLRPPVRRDQFLSDSTDSLRKRSERDTLSRPAEAARSGRISAAPSTGSVTEVIWYTVPQDRYEHFKRELAAQSAIESETPVAMKARESAMKFDRLLIIKVTVLPPVITEPAAPSQAPPSSR